MRADGQTNVTKLTFAFRNFAKAPKKHYSFRRLGTLVRKVLSLVFVLKRLLFIISKEIIIIKAGAS
jgi:hypothetical protein